MQTEGLQQNPLLTAAAKEKRKSIFKLKFCLKMITSLSNPGVSHAASQRGGMQL